MKKREKKKRTRRNFLLVSIGILFFVIFLSWFFLSQNGLRFFLWLWDLSNPRIVIEDVSGSFRSKIKIESLTYKRDGLKIELNDIDCKLNPFSLLRRTYVIEELISDQAIVTINTLDQYRQNLSVNDLKNFNLKSNIDIKSAYIANVNFKLDAKILMIKNLNFSIDINNNLVTFRKLNWENENYLSQVEGYIDLKDRCQVELEGEIERLQAASIFWTLHGSFDKKIEFKLDTKKNKQNLKESTAVQDELAKSPKAKIELTFSSHDNHKTDNEDQKSEIELQATWQNITLSIFNNLSNSEGRIDIKGPIEKYKIAAAITLSSTELPEIEAKIHGKGGTNYLNLEKFSLSRNDDNFLQGKLIYDWNSKQQLISEIDLVNFDINLFIPNISSKINSEIELNWHTDVKKIRAKLKGLFNAEKLDGDFLVKLINEKNDKHRLTADGRVELGANSLYFQDDREKKIIWQINITNLSQIIPHIYGQISDHGELQIENSRLTLSNKNRIRKLKSNELYISSLDIDNYLNVQRKDKKLNIRGETKLFDESKISYDLKLPNKNPFILSTWQKLVGTIDIDSKDLSPFSKLIPNWVKKIDGKLKLKVKIRTGFGNSKFEIDGALDDGLVHLNRHNTYIEDIKIDLVSNKKGDLEFYGKGIIDKNYLNLKGRFNASNSTGSAEIWGEKLLFLNRPPIKLVISPNLKIDYDLFQIKIDGNIDIDTANIVIAEYRKVIKLPTETYIISPSKENIKITDKIDFTSNIAINLGNNFRLASKGLVSNLMGELQFQIDSSLNTNVFGEVYLINGVYQMGELILPIQKGSLIFNGEKINNPKLNLHFTKEIKNMAIIPDFSYSTSQVISDIENILVEIKVTGTVEDPQINTFADPAVLSREEILASFVLGSLSNNSSFDKGNSAENLGKDSFIKGLFQKLGLSDFNIKERPELKLDDNYNETNYHLTISKAIMPKLYIHYLTGLSIPYNLFQLNYYFSSHLLLRSETSHYESGIDLLYIF